MKQTVSEHDFIQAFEDCGRGDQFSYDALRALFDYLTEYEESTGEELELDPIAVCCDFAEYESAWEAMQEYQPDDMPVIDLEATVDEDGVGPDLTEVEEAQQEAALEWLRDQTTVLELDSGGVVIFQF